MNTRNLKNTKSLAITGERFFPGMSGFMELEHIHRYSLALTLSKGKQVLDVASGEGYGSHMLASVAASVIGVDISTEAIEHSRLKYSASNLEFRQGSCVNLPINDSSIDLVVSFETIEHHDLHEEMLSEITRVLRPDGFLLISSPNKLFFSDIPGKQVPFHVKELYLNELKVLLQDHFHIVDFYGQRALTSSVVVPIRSVDSTFKQMQLSEGRVTTESNLDPSIYFLALAGRSGPLPSLGVSIYENDSSNDFSNDTQLSPAILESRIYWRCQSKKQFYSENRSASEMFLVDGKSHQIHLELSEDALTITNLRLDILNAIGVVVIHAIKLVDQDQRIIWKWEGDSKNFDENEQCVIFTNSDSEQCTCTVVSFGGDPQIEIDLPTAVYAQITSGCALEMTLTPYTLMDYLPGLLQFLAGLADQRCSAILMTAPTTSLSTAFDLNLTSNLEEMEVLLRQSLASRDRLLAHQHQQLQQMRDELVRAEAQLDLLKDVLLNRIESGRL